MAIPIPPALVRVMDFYGRSVTPQPIDLILTDVRMPVCSGFDIVEGLREARWPTPVIIMTAFGDDEARARAKALSAVLLDKPFEMAALRTLVRELLPANVVRTHDHDITPTGIDPPH